MRTDHPIVIIGAGPIGLAAAANVVERGGQPIVLEAGPHVGHTIRDWAHVRLFSNWESVIDPASRRLLDAQGWTAPAALSYPTGGDLVSQYLEPLGEALAPHIRFAHRVTAVSRTDVDKLVTPGRDGVPFLVRVATPQGETDIVAGVVIDASGTWDNPNPLGSSGLPVPGETANPHLRHGMPDVLGRDRDRYAGKRVLVVGAGHSAANVLLDLTTLAEQVPGTEVVWAIRRPDPSRALGGLEDDELVERGKIGIELGHRVDAGRIQLVTSFRVASLDIRDGKVSATSLAGDEPVTIEVDEVVASTGQRPDLAVTRELRLDLDPLLEAPRGLAPAIDPNEHSCGTVPPHGVDELSHPEADFYTVGIKSYGRAPTFLMATGYEQVRSVVAAVFGDWEAARRVELTLSETGACGVSTTVLDVGVDGQKKGLTLIDEQPSGCC